MSLVKPIGLKARPSEWDAWQEQHALEHQSLDALTAVLPVNGTPVTTARQINTTAPLAGGGDLSADRTLSVNNNGVTNALLSQMAANTVKGNNTGGTANAVDVTVAQTLALLGVFGKVSAFKTGDTTSTSTTLTNDADLQLTVVTGTYNLEAFLAFYEAVLGTGGFQFDLAGGSATVGSILWGADGYVTAVAGNPAATAANTAQSYGTVATASTAPSWVKVQGQVTFSSGGTFILRWAQASASANATTFKAKSLMTLERVA